MNDWVISNGQLTLAERAEGATPTADDIYRSILEGEQLWPDVAPGRTGAAADLAFSRYPAIPLLVLSSPAGFPTISFEATLPAAGRIAIASATLSAGHLIDKGIWYPLDPESANSVRSLATRAGLPDGGRIRSLRTILDLKQELESGLIDDRLQLDTELAIRLAPKLDGTPAGVDATLYAYQLDGWRWLRFVVGERVGGFLGDEMGLGKTLQIISAIADPGAESARPALIVAPGSILENWCREFNRFSPTLSVLKHHGATRTGSPAALSGYDVVVTSYETVVRDGALMNMQEWSLVVLDEAQNIRNPSAVRTRAAKRLRRKVGLAVTGTPMENRLLDIWSIMDFVRPGYLGSEADFSKRFVDNNEAAEQLEPLVSPLILRRRISEVAQDLPERIDTPQYLELETETASRYDDLRLSISHEYGKAASLVALTKLRMFCAHPGLVSDDSQDVDFIKLQRLDEVLAEIFSCGEKALIFTSYTEMADKIVDRITAGFAVFADTLDGRCAIPDRQGLIDRFTATVGAAALILNPRAGGSGLNITAANHVIHYNPEWNPALEDQASARAHRRGQVRPVTVHRFLLVGTVEEVIDQRLRRKRNLSSAAIVGVAGQEDDYEDIVVALNRSPLVKGP